MLPIVAFGGRVSGGSVLPASVCRGGNVNIGDGVVVTDSSVVDGNVGYVHCGGH